MVMNPTQATFFACVFCGIEFRDNGNGLANPSAAQNLEQHMQAHHSEGWRLLKSAVARFGIPNTTSLTKQDVQDLLDRENQILFDVQMVKQQAAQVNLRQREERAYKIAEQVNEQEVALRREENIALSEVFSRLAEAEQEVERLRAENAAMLAEKRADILLVKQENAAKMAEFQDTHPGSKLDEMVADGAVSPDLEGSNPDPVKPKAPRPPSSGNQGKAGQTQAKQEAQKPPAGEAKSDTPEAGDKKE